MFYNEQAEKVLLGKIVTEPFENENYILNLEEKDFYNSFNQAIFKQVKKLYLNKKEIDIVSISDTFNNNEDAFNYLADISNVSILENTKTHFKIVKEKSCRRQILDVCKETAEQLKDFEQNFDEIRFTASRKMQEIELEKMNDGTDAQQIVDNIIKKAERLYNGDKTIINEYMTSIKVYDIKTGGLQRQELTLLAARPGVGKTSFMLQMVYKITRNAKRPLKILILSLEMSKEQIMTRMMCNVKKIDSMKFKNGNIEEKDFPLMVSFHNSLAPHEIVVEDKITTTAQLRILQKKEKFDLIYIDYLQLMTPLKSYGTRNDQVGEISRDLKLITREFEIPLVALSQLKRLKGTRPTKEDLRDSGSLEQDADNIVFLHDREPDNKNVKWKDIEFIIEKQRNGECGVFPIRFIPKFTRFENYE